VCGRDSQIAGEREVANDAGRAGGAEAERRREPAEGARERERPFRGSGSGTGLLLLNSGALPPERVDRRMMLESMEMSVLVCCCVLVRSIGSQPAFGRNLALRMSYITHELRKLRIQ